MCSLDLYNWYENRFPNDFKQLIQIKHYNISDLSFLLSKIWYKLDYGEKLLMCAVYYDDINLAKQMLNEKQFKVNPFYGKHYQISSTSRNCSSNTGSLSNVFQSNDINDLANSNVFIEPFSLTNDTNETKNASPRLNRHRRLSWNKEEKKCWCKNDYLSRASLSTSVNTPIIIDAHYEPSKNLKLTNTINSIGSNLSLSSSNESIIDSFSQQETSFDLFSHNGQQLINTSPSYFLNHALCELSTQTPFYFAIKLNNLRMCQLFMDSLKKAYLTSLSAKLIKKQLLQSQMDCIHRNQSSNSFKTSKTVYLNSILSNGELVKLLMISLSNRNYELAQLLLSNVQNAKQILNFQHFSESFIYNEKFCLYLLKNKIVDIKLLLKEATTRHATSTTYYLINYLEQLNEKQLSKTSLFNIFKCGLTSSILIGDMNIFNMLLTKVCKHLNSDEQNLNSIFPDLTIKNVLTNNYQTILDKLKLSTMNDSNIIDLDITKRLATTKGLNCDLYYKAIDLFYFKQEPVRLYSNKLSYLNRLKLLKYIFCDSNEQIEHFFNKIWLDLETKTKKKLSSYDKIFAATEYNLESEKITSLNMKRFYLGRYLVYAESEPFLVNSLLQSFKNSYKLTSSDLIQAAKSEISELSIHYLLANLNDFSSFDHLLEPDDDLYGNFLEIIFCRLVKCTDMDKELRLRLLFFEAIILKNAKMTCSTNLLNLFVTNSQHVQKRLLNIYFPCLFYLINTFLQFKTELHKERFQLLLDWFVKNCLFADESNEIRLYVQTLNAQQLEMIIFEFYSKKMLKQKFNFNFDFTLQELARNSFMKVFVNDRNGTDYNFVNLICDSARYFIFYFNELRSLFN